MTKRTRAPKVVCPMSGQCSGSFGGYDQCEHCGRMVFIADRDGRIAKHYLPAAMARTATR